MMGDPMGTNKEIKKNLSTIKCEGITFLIPRHTNKIQKAKSLWAFVKQSI